MLAGASKRNPVTLHLIGLGNDSAIDKRDRMCFAIGLGNRTKRERIKIEYNRMPKGTKHEQMGGE